MPMYPLQNICTNPWIYKLKSHFNAPISYFAVFYFSPKQTSYGLVLWLEFNLFHFIVNFN